MPVSIMDLLSLESVTFRIQRQRETSRAGSGTTFSKDLGPALWGMSATSVPYLHADAERIMALIESMEDDLDTFYAWNPAVEYPQADPDGAIFGSSTPVIHSINADNKHFSISGLPASYVLTRGDKVAVDYSSPSRRAVYVVVDASVTADGSGITAEFEVSPHIRSGLSTSDPCYLIKPAATMKIIPGTLQCSTETAVTSRISFQAMEQP